MGLTAKVLGVVALSWAIAGATAVREGVKHEDPTPARQAREKKSALRLHVQPTVGQAPMSVKVVIDVARDEENRWLVVQVESVEFYRSSRIQLDGAYAARIYERTYENLGPGSYVVTAGVFGKGGVRAEAARPLTISN
jgi:hypothetical protein